MDFLEFHKIISRTKIKHWREYIPRTFHDINHGDLDKWLAVIEELPDINANHINLKSDTIEIGKKEELSDISPKILKENLKKLHPWRKGPFNFFGIDINTEWRSDWKWNRLKDHIAPLKNKFLLDVGCGNGYHCLRMAGEEARMVVGIDPFILFVFQFMVFKKYLGHIPVFVLPVGIEDIPKNQSFFHTVFSMGVFYHRKSPFDHLQELRSLLRHNGQLVLETLIIDGGNNEVLVPSGRYGKMRNVWFLPSPDTMISWLNRAGFKNPRIVDATQTTIQEQRKTDWMTFESLEDYLDPENANKTIEGYPAPKRAIFIAEK
ncbi:MAG: tRNA 5-methoxyuridine(34)/uridine 5-oxyacetic acid(34) synthase CmoB [Fidelibacterota bacterium]